MKNGKPNVHIRLTDKHLWARIRAQAALESVPVSVVVQRALEAWLDGATFAQNVSPRRASAHRATSASIWVSVSGSSPV